MGFLPLLIVSYLIGAIPFGLVLTQLVHGVDIRTRGSGNIGATNVGREMGWTWGICVLVLDALKGVFPTLLPIWFSSYEGIALSNAMVACGTAAAVGHMFPIYLKFRGGKGVATGLGVAAAVSPWSTLVAFLTFVVLTATLRWVSLSSVIAALAFAVTQTVRFGTTLFDPASLPVLLFSYGVPLLIIVQHRSNLRRLLRGEEPKTFGKKREPDATFPASAGDA